MALEMFYDEPVGFGGVISYGNLGHASRDSGITECARGFNRFTCWPKVET